MKKISPVVVVFLALFLLEAGLTVDYAEARSRMGGRMFSKPIPRKAPVRQNMQQNTQKSQQQKGVFGRGLAGGLLGGALGAMLFGSLFGASGQGFGLLPLLLLGGVAFFLFRRKAASSSAGGFSTGASPTGDMFNLHGEQPCHETDSGTQPRYLTALEQGLEEIRRTDPGFDQNHFVEVASDVFFQVQAGWMRRDLDSYRHLLGEQLAGEYASHFEKMRRAGEINKLESIAIRRLEPVNAGSDGTEDFVTVLFTANLLDYTVDETSGELVSGSMTQPVKFAEEWTWARPSGTESWLLEGIKVIEEE